MGKSEALTPVVLEADMTTAGTAYTVTLPVGTKHFQMRNVGSADVRFAFQAGKVESSTAPYYTLKQSRTFWAPGKLGHKQ